MYSHVTTLTLTVTLNYESGYFEVTNSSNFIYIKMANSTKGQLILKFLFGVIVLTQIATKILKGFLP